MTRRIVGNRRTVGLAGFGPATGWVRNGWWECLNDVARDINRNYRYYVVTETGPIDLALADGRVIASAGDANALERLPTNEHDLERLHAQRDTLLDMHLRDRRES